MWQRAKARKMLAEERELRAGGSERKKETRGQQLIVVNWHFFGRAHCLM